MCLVVALHRVADDAPLLIVANREEEYARGGETLGWRHGRIPFLAGRDPQAGGTWFGVNAHGVTVAVTNRPKTLTSEPYRSRGLLVTDLLQCSSAREAIDAASRELSRHCYRGCNILCSDSDSLQVVHAGDWLRVRSLAPGIHVLTNADINDPFDARIAFIMEQVQSQPIHQALAGVALLKRLGCLSTGPVPLCLLGSQSGTVASTILALSTQPRQSRLFHAHGSPAEYPYIDRTDLLWELEGLTQGRP